ncbi:hypothetical protein [Candidatus Electronema sp. PJ]|uniref:hypothetical protein n=1 Tax=Candidatus Electronema sp. PJ TaxID=3401572 RepID=UPI003AA90477
MAKEEFCRLSKELYSAAKESGRLQLLAYRAKLLGKRAGMQDISDSMCCLCRFHFI